MPIVWTIDRGEILVVVVFVFERWIQIPGTWISPMGTLGGATMTSLFPFFLSLDESTQ